MGGMRKMVKSSPLSMVEGKRYSALRNAWIVPFI